MLVTILLFVLGLVLMCVAGDKFVDAAVNIANKIGIPQIVVGATIVSIGTTLPEVLVSTTAALGGSADIAAGNAFGSIICNTALIASIGQLISPTKQLNTKAFNWRALFFFGVCALLALTGYITGSFNRITGIFLLLLFVLYSYINIKRAKAEGEEENLNAVSSEPMGKSLIILVVTAAMLFIGARLLVNNGQIIAKALGVPERVIALTFIALGTSLPELVTTISSLIKKQGAVGLGNIIGANILNMVLVMGIPSAITGVHFEQQVLKVDIPVGFAFMFILTVPMMIKKRGYRWQGLVLLAGYAAYCIMLF